MLLAHVMDPILTILEVSFASFFVFQKVHALNLLYKLPTINDLIHSTNKIKSTLQKYQKLKYSTISIKLIDIYGKRKKQFMYSHA